MTITSHIMISIAAVALASILAWFVVGPAGATAEVHSCSGDTHASTVVVATISGRARTRRTKRLPGAGAPGHRRTAL
jgi:hypothetical protein